jgi:predicted metal-dependent phosphoesterase TrpH
MYKIDTHVHTCEVSTCAQVGARDVVRLYKEAGYDGIVITDHYYEGFFHEVDEISWENQIDYFLNGYRNAAEEGEKLGLKVFLGAEIRFTENPSDYLVYGVTEEFLKANPRLHQLGVKGFKKLIEKEDILIFQAHPFRSRMVVADPLDVHGVEVYNGNPRQNSMNHKAFSYAIENGMRMSSGSDFHQVEDLARGGIIFEREIMTSGEFVKALREQEYKELIYTKE